MTIFINPYKTFAVGVRIRPDNLFGIRRVGAVYTLYVSAPSKVAAESMALSDAIKKGVPERRVSVNAVEYIVSSVRV